MNKTSFDELMNSVTEMDRIIHGHETVSRTTRFTDPEVKEIREKTGLSQIQFAGLIGVSKRTRENWGQGRKIGKINDNTGSGSKYVHEPFSGS